LIIRDFVKELLNHNLNGKVTIEYPNEKQNGHNYYRYQQAEDFDIVECSDGIIIGISNDNQ